MNHDLHQLANAVRHAHHIGRPICLPPMTMRDLGILLRLLDDLNPAIAIHHNAFINYDINKEQSYDQNPSATF